MTVVRSYPNTKQKNIWYSGQISLYFDAFLHTYINEPFYMMHIKNMMSICYLHSLKFENHRQQVVSSAYPIRWMTEAFPRVLLTLVLSFDSGYSRGHSRSYLLFIDIHLKLIAYSHPSSCWTRRHFSVNFPIL